jgi:hypothetical protein
VQALTPPRAPRRAKAAAVSFPMPLRPHMAMETGGEDLALSIIMQALLYLLDGDVRAPAAALLPRALHPCLPRATSHNCSQALDWATHRVNLTQVRHVKLLQAGTQAAGHSSSSSSSSSSKDQTSSIVVLCLCKEEAPFCYRNSRLMSWHLPGRTHCMLSRGCPRDRELYMSSPSPDPMGLER